VYLVASSPPLGYVDGADPLFLPLPAREGGEPAKAADWALLDCAELTEAIAAAISPVRPDILHFHYAHPFVRCAAGLRRRLGRECPRMVCTVHGTDIVYLPEAALGEFAAAIGDLDAITAVSTDLSSRAAVLLSIPAPIVIPNFIDLNRALDRPQREPGDRPVRFVHVSNFQPVKRLNLLVDVFRRVARHTDSLLWMVGDGPDRSSAEEAVARAGLEGRVVWWGVRRDVDAILAQADVALITSAYESFSMFALEAMAAGAPVLAFEVGGLPEVIGAANAHWLHPSGDTDRLARAAIVLAGDRARLASMRSQGRLAANVFRESAIIPRYESLYRDLSSRPRRRIGDRDG
jgi:N-acetyl-alpha-D-glucosaminyl L-malate synthase BshA